MLSIQETIHSAAGISDLILSNRRWLEILKSKSTTPGIPFNFAATTDMDRNSGNSSGPPSRDSTPHSAAQSRFTSQNATAEDLLKSQTVGLVQLSDFRKRRAEVLEQKEREAQDQSYGSGLSTPVDG